MIRHGTQRSYDEGCHCDLCTTKNRERGAAKRARRQASSTALMVRPDAEPEPEQLADDGPRDDGWTWTAEVIDVGVDGHQDHAQAPEVDDPPRPAFTTRPYVRPSFRSALRAALGLPEPVTAPGDVRPAEPRPVPREQGHAPDYRSNGPGPRFRSPAVEAAPEHSSGFVLAAQQASAASRGSVEPAQELAPSSRLRGLAADPRTRPFLCPHGGVTPATLAMLGTAGDADFVCEACTRTGQAPKTPPRPRRVSHSAGRSADGDQPQPAGYPR
jgi:hypothetical protein